MISQNGEHLGLRDNAEPRGSYRAGEITCALMRSLRTRLAFPSVRMIVCTAVSLALPNGCGQREITCQGVCPAPDPGVVVDAGLLEKSVWLTADRLGSPDGVEPALCSVQVNNTPEDEILFRGNDGVAIVTLNGTRAGDTVFMPTAPGEVLEMIDTDHDGDLEFVFCGGDTARYYDSDGSMLAGPLSARRFHAVDFDGDGLIELVIVSLDDDVIVLNADGSERATIEGVGPFVEFGRIEAGGAFVIVTSDNWGETWNARVWSPDGEQMTHLIAADMVGVHSHPREGVVSTLAIRAWTVAPSRKTRRRRWAPFASSSLIRRHLPAD